MKYVNRKSPFSRSVRSWLALSFLISSPVPAVARLNVVKVTSQDKIESGRGLFDPDGAPKGRAAVKALTQMKRARLDRKFGACASAAAAARKAAPEVKAWISVQELECADAGGANKETGALVSALAAAEAIKDGFSAGVTAPALRRNWVEARLALIDLDVKKNRSRAQAGIDRLESVQNWLDGRQKAHLWRAAGELAFAQQRLDEAREYIQRSLALTDSAELRGRLASIEVSLAGKTKASDALAKPTPAPASTPDLEASPAENEIVARMTSALKAGDLVPAVEDGIKLIRDYPGGTRAKWAADRIQEVFLNLGGKSEEKYTLLRDRVVKQMERADADRLAEWARVGYNRGLYGDSLRLARKALETMADAARSTKTYSLAAEAALHVDRFDLSKELYETLVHKHAGTPASREALLRVGLLEYRLKNYPLAIAAFERLLVLPQTENYELTARHWLWRSLQKTKDEKRAREQAEILMTKFPFSYYGLRARAETLGGGASVEWPAETAPKIESRFLVTSFEKGAFERARILIEAGWFDEAQTEMAQLPTPTKPEEKAVLARLWAAAFHYPLATKLVNEAWDANPGFRKAPFLDVAFPREFTRVIESQAAARKLEPALVMSLIKQESAYNIRAVSSSNALGLMQIIPPTAREIAQDLKIGDLTLPDDLFVPAQNIRMGSYYLSKVLRKVSGHVPLGLASYNAGPYKVERWMKSRPSLSGLAGVRSSNPDDELWFDELPWDETSYYVKAILRNLILYRVLDKGRIEVKSPIWDAGGEAQQASSEKR